MLGDIIFTFGVLVTLLCWGGAAYLWWNQHRKTKKAVSRPHHVIGEVQSINFDENGLTITGKLNEHGKALSDAGELGYITAGFTNVSGSVNLDGTRVITNARLHSVSVDHEPGPYGGKIDYVGTQPEDKDA